MYLIVFDQLKNIRETLTGKLPERTVGVMRRRIQIEAVRITSRHANHVQTLTARIYQVAELHWLYGGKKTLFQHSKTLKVGLPRQNRCHSYWITKRVGCFIPSHLQH